MIENGGHGGTAAAPAALKVFQKFFKVRDYDRDHPRVRLMAFEAVDTRARGLRPHARPSEAAGLVAVVRGLDWGSSARRSRSSRYGLWAIDGITRHDPGGAGRRQALYAAVGQRRLRRVRR